MADEDVDVVVNPGEAAISGEMAKKPSQRVDTAQIQDQSGFSSWRGMVGAGCVSIALSGTRPWDCQERTEPMCTEEDTAA